MHRVQHPQSCHCKDTVNIVRNLHKSRSRQTSKNAQICKSKGKPPMPNRKPIIPEWIWHLNIEKGRRKLNPDIAKLCKVEQHTNAYYWYYYNVAHHLSLPFKTKRRTCPMISRNTISCLRLEHPRTSWLFTFKHHRKKIYSTLFNEPDPIVNQSIKQ